LEKCYRSLQNAECIFRKEIMGTIRFLIVSKFRRGVTTDGDDKRSGCKSTSKMAENVDCVKELGHDSRRITIRAIANM
jgi:hypothetical protein